MGIRSRLVVKEIKTDNRQDLFVATPPLEAKELLFSSGATQGTGFLKGKKLEGTIDFVDIIRGLFQAGSIRQVYVDLPDADYILGMRGLLEKSMYRTRDAAQNWGEAYSGFMRSIGFVTDKRSPCAFWHPAGDLRVLVHGNDFNVLGWEKATRLVLGLNQGQH